MAPRQILTATVSHGGEPVRTRHGLMLLPRGSTKSLTTARVLAPFASGVAADPTGATELPESGPPYGAIQAALDDLASTAGRPIAEFAAKRLEHRVNQLDAHRT